MGDRKAQLPSDSRVLHHAISKPKASAVVKSKNSMPKSVSGNRTYDNQGKSNSGKTWLCPESKRSPETPSPAQTQTQTQKLSPIERLPGEILEAIFMQTPSFNLIRASPYLASKLSTFRVRKELLMHTCSSQPRVDLSEVSPQYSKDKDLAEVQTALLRQKWLDLAFLRRCIPDYMTSVLLQEFSALGLQWLDPSAPVVTPALEPRIREFVQSIFSSAIAKPYGKLNDFTEIAWKEGGARFPKRLIDLCLGPREGLVVLRITDCTRKCKYQSRHRILCLSMQCRIPNKLLHGPWSNDKCELLDITVRGNATIAWVDTTSGEVAEEGFWDALRERNANALQALIIQNPVKTGFTMLRTILGVGITPRQEHLVFAIKDGCRADIVNILLHAPTSNVNLQEDAILRLLHAMDAQKHPQAGWLRERMEFDRIWRTRRAEWNSLTSPRFTQ